MKMFLKIIKYRFISSLKHPTILVCLLMAFAGSMVVGVYAQRLESDPSLYPIAIVDEDGGEYAELFIEQLSNNTQINLEIMNREKALTQVSTGRIDGAFVLLDGFSAKIKDEDFVDIVEFISPSVTTSAYPLSEIVSSEIVDLWLTQMVENHLKDYHKNLGENALLSFDEVVDNMNSKYTRENIITLEYIGDSTVQAVERDVAPIDRAVGIYAAFVIFAVMLSGEWIFNIKKRDLQGRFISSNTNISMVCLASQLSSILIAMLFFVPLIVLLSVYLSVSIQVVLHLIAGMFLYLICICSMAFIVSIFTNNLTQLIVVGTSVSIANILLSSLAMPLPNWAATANTVSKVLPGTYLIGCYDNVNQFAGLLLVTLVWVLLGYLGILKLRKIAKA